MAVTRKFLSALGIESDKIDEIIAAHTDTINGLKEERDQYKESAEKLEAAEKELGKLRAKVAESDGKNPFEEKYNTIKKEFDTYKNEITQKEKKEQRSNAYRQLLKEARVSDKYIDTVLKVSNIDSIEFDEDGKIKNAKELTDGIKNEWSDFIVTSTAQGEAVATPPTNNAKPEYAGRAKQLAAEYYANQYGAPPAASKKE